MGHVRSDGIEQGTAISANLYSLWRLTSTVKLQVTQGLELKDAGVMDESQMQLPELKF